MRKPILLGIHSLKTGGKDTVFKFAQEWAEWAGLTSTKRGFADQGKLSFARQYFPDISLADAIAWCDEFKFTGKMIVIEHAHWPARKKIHTFEGREPLANLLTEGGRELHGEDVWVDLLLPNGTIGPDKGGTFYPKWWEEFEYQYQDGPWVADICGITDVRFKNEIERVKDLGGVAVKVNRDSATQAVIEEAKRKGWGAPHASELGLTDQYFDFVLDNNGSLNTLGQKVRDMMDVIYARQKAVN